MQAHVKVISVSNIEHRIKHRQIQWPLKDRPAHLVDLVAFIFGFLVILLITLGPHGIRRLPRPQGGTEVTRIGPVFIATIGAIDN